MPMGVIGKIYFTSAFRGTNMVAMEKEFAAAAGASPQHQTISTEAKCPVVHGSRAHTNTDWWPNQLNLKVLHQRSPMSDPMGQEFNYAEEFKTLDLNAVVKDLH